MSPVPLVGRLARSRRRQREPPPIMGSPPKGRKLVVGATTRQDSLPLMAGTSGLRRSILPAMETRPRIGATASLRSASKQLSTILVEEGTGRELGSHGESSVLSSSCSRETRLKRCIDPCFLHSL